MSLLCGTWQLSEPRNRRLICNRKCSSFHSPPPWSSPYCACWPQLLRRLQHYQNSSDASSPGSHVCFFLFQIHLQAGPGGAELALGEAGRGVSSCRGGQAEFPLPFSQLSVRTADWKGCRRLGWCSPQSRQKAGRAGSCWGRSWPWVQPFECSVKGCWRKAPCVDGCAEAAGAGRQRLGGSGMMCLHHMGMISYFPVH